MTDREKFYDLLSNYPYLDVLWDKETHRVDLDRINTEYFSHYQIVVKDVILSIWDGRSNSKKIDITDLAALNLEDKKPLLEWIWTPFWP